MKINWISLALFALLNIISLSDFFPPSKKVQEERNGKKRGVKKRGKKWAKKAKNKKRREKKERKNKKKGKEKNARSKGVRQRKKRDERAGSKKREEEGERRQSNGLGKWETRHAGEWQWPGVYQKSEPEEGENQRGEGEVRKREREREWEKEKEREQACAAGHHNMFWLLRSVRSFLCTSVRLSVVCPGTPTECIAVWPRWRVSDRLSLGLYTLWGSFKRLSVLLLHLLLLRPFLLIAPRISAVFLPPLPPPPFSSSSPSLSSFFFFPFFSSTRNSLYPRSALSASISRSDDQRLYFSYPPLRSSFVEIIFVHFYQWSCNFVLIFFFLAFLRKFFSSFFFYSFAILIARFLIPFLNSFRDSLIFSSFFLQFFILVVFVEIIFCLYQFYFIFFNKIPFYVDSRKKYSVGFDNGKRYALICARWKYRRFVSSESNSSHKGIRGLQTKRIKVKNNAKRMVP